MDVSKGVEFGGQVEDQLKQRDEEVAGGSVRFEIRLWDPGDPCFFLGRLGQFGLSLHVERWQTHLNGTLDVDKKLYSHQIGFGWRTGYRLPTMAILKKDAEFGEVQPKTCQKDGYIQQCLFLGGVIGGVVVVI